MDFPSDLRASLYVLLGGYYKQAMLCLRNWMEIRLLAVYFARVDGSKYADWKEGKTTHKDKLFGTRPLRALFDLAEFKAADARFKLLDLLLALYGETSVFLHGAAVEKHDLQADTDNVPRYNARSVALYLDLLRRVWTAVTYCLWLAYGADAFREAGGDTARTIIAALPEPFLSEVRPALPKS